MGAGGRVYTCWHLPGWGPVGMLQLMVPLDMLLSFSSHPQMELLLLLALQIGKLKLAIKRTPSHSGPLTRDGQSELLHCAFQRFGWDMGV